MDISSRVILHKVKEPVPDQANWIESLSNTERFLGVKHILILMADAGGGHRAAAEAIQEGLIHLYGDAVSVAIVDAWKNHFTWPTNYLPNAYGWIVNEVAWLWKTLWLLEKHQSLTNTILKSAYPLVAPGLLKLFETQKPDVIVSVHPLLIPISLMVLRRARLDTPFVTVVTDMAGGFHLWYHRQTTLCLVPTELAQKQALNLGIPSEKIEVVGQPVALKFAKGMGEKAYLRRKLGLNQNRPVVLLVSGGEGYGRVFEIARCIAHRVPQTQLVVVAGRNKSLKQKLEAADWPIPTIVFGFVNNMPELMGAADVFITKAGPGSISEAFVARLPLILFDYIPGQEESNVRYVVEHNAGIYVPNPDQIVDILLDWLRPDNPIPAQMARSAANLAHPEAALTVARRVYEQATK